MDYRHRSALFGLRRAARELFGDPSHELGGRCDQPCGPTGIVAAYWLTGSANSLPMFLGAMVVGLLTVWLTEWTREWGRVDEGAATGVVFTGSLP